MNKYARALLVVPFGALKIMWTKLFHIHNFKGPIMCMISLRTEISLDYSARLSIGKMFKMRDGAKLRVRKNAECKIGDNSSMGTNCIITCREKIIIGDNVSLSPGVLIYDHDHDFRHSEGIKAGTYKTAPVMIGNDCWIGANTVILRGTTIGDNCVVGAGSVIKGDFPAGTVIVQKRDTKIRGGGRIIYLVPYMNENYQKKIA